MRLLKLISYINTVLKVFSFDSTSDIWFLFFPSFIFRTKITLLSSSLQKCDALLARWKIHFSMKWYHSELGIGVIVDFRKARFYDFLGPHDTISYDFTTFSKIFKSIKKILLESRKKLLFMCNEKKLTTISFFTIH